MKCSKRSLAVITVFSLSLGIGHSVRATPVLPLKRLRQHRRRKPSGSASAIVARAIAIVAISTNCHRLSAERFIRIARDTAALVWDRDDRQTLLRPMNDAPLLSLASVPRTDSRLDAVVKTSAIILRAVPSKVPFAQLTQIYCKVFFGVGRGPTGDLPEFRLRIQDGTHHGEGPDVSKEPCARIPGLDSILALYAPVRPSPYCRAASLHHGISE